MTWKNASSCECHFVEQEEILCALAAEKHFEAVTCTTLSVLSLWLPGCGFNSCGKA